ncbi:hypothetical protein AMAG_13115 [Allomyces macrogynus ATCC 38327]|uniref:Uncharacterized protein n=1 Tax=Allomyces macrogynus (strain ATCC 38327) TaxID=578462 RepID=A0A0L0SZF2_ALLM3|nr:hypothetical protein AMAG_13115 [Allomyces macrogynus ATCC 38327]|eukprot:KNE67928.1 hypothetical protein AMAG_13115 [Allomyces macrogynus ATCC 38327]
MAAARNDRHGPDTPTAHHVLTARFSVSLPALATDAGATVRPAQAKVTVAATLAVPTTRSEALPDLASLAATLDIDAAPSALPAAAASAHRVVGAHFACSLSVPAATPAAGGEIRPQCNAASSAWIAKCLAAVWAPMDVVVVPHHLDQHAALDNPHTLVLASATMIPRASASLVHAHPQLRLPAPSRTATLIAIHVHVHIPARVASEVRAGLCSPTPVTDPATRAFVAALVIATRVHFQRLFPRIFSAPYVTTITKSATYLPTMATAMANILHRRRAARLSEQPAESLVPVPAADHVHPEPAAPATRFGDETDLITAATHLASTDATTQLLYRLIRTAALKIRIPRPAPDWIASVASGRPGAPVSDGEPPPLNHSQHRVRDAHAALEPAWLAEIDDYAWEPIVAQDAGGSQVPTGASSMHSSSLDGVNWEPLGVAAVGGFPPSSSDLAGLAESMTQDDVPWEPLGRVGVDPRDPLGHIGADARPPVLQLANGPGFAESATLDDVSWVRVGPVVTHADLVPPHRGRAAPESAEAVEDVEMVDNDDEDDLWEWQRVRDGVNVPALPDLSEMARRAAALAEFVEDNEMAWEPLGHGRL